MSENKNLMLYDANKKSPVVAYLLLIFLGGFGAHRFYLRLRGTAFLLVLMTLLGWVFLAVAVEIAAVPFLVVGGWYIVDLFRTGALVRTYNHDLIQRLEAP